MIKFLKLLRKDWRVNRAPMIALLLIAIGPYALCAAIYYFSESAQNSRDTLDDYMGRAAMMGIFFGCVIAAAFGGAAFAIERHERWADFLAMVPAPRWQVVLSKLIVGLGPLYLAAVLNGLVLLTIPPHGLPPNDVDFMLTFFAGGYLGVFGVAWLCSTFLDSAAIAAGVSIGLGCAMFLFMSLHFSGKSVTDPEIIDWVISPVSAAGLGTIILGSVYYARRVAP